MLTSASAFAVQGTLVGERTTYSQKVCFYAVAGTTRTVTIAKFQSCPFTMNF